ncbi:ActS/PrrB/RegB family redox-sensitive histidine kinase [Brevundimonas sp. 2R-24]|uniref:histidine kinase n=1 Tax=Peiella sedimenti TaxID=3061083 RepID=A0ABT8SLL3_9CAUL|nr:ActS/PrrB/RegB family redox-sensitive histidine kinase [Caulobacteraceae bacterium XZ-24]
MPWSQAASENAFMGAPKGRRGRLRIRTLVFLRWMALVGQTAAVLITAFVFKFDIPLGLCLGAIASGAWMNVVLSMRIGEPRLPRDWDVAAQLAFDIVQLSVLLAFTGGLDNPFSLLLIAPTVIAAGTLAGRQAAMVGLVGLAAAAVLYHWSMPLPWYAGLTVEMPPLYRLGMWIAMAVGTVFTGVYVWLAAREARRMELALQATQGVLAREQRLAALGGLAAAAAHELGTPLATIQVVAKELLRGAAGDKAVAEDAQLLLEQADRCRAILKQLSEQPETSDQVQARLRLPLVLEEVAQAYRGIGPRIETRVEMHPPHEPPPLILRQPELIHGLSAFVENAADFAVFAVTVTARVDRERIEIEVRDDGPGFSADVLTRLGEPYVTSRPTGEDSRSGHHGMGLGFFIAKTLLERIGGRVTFKNAKAETEDEDGGALVRIVWPRRALEAPPAPDDIDVAASRRGTQASAQGTQSSSAGSDDRKAEIGAT